MRALGLLITSGALLGLGAGVASARSGVGGRAGVLAGPADRAGGGRPAVVPPRRADAATQADVPMLGAGAGTLAAGAARSGPAAEQVGVAAAGAAVAGPGGGAGAPPLSSKNSSESWSELKGGPSVGANVGEAQATSALAPDLVLGALAMETAVRAEPAATAKLLGFLRAGTLVRRSAEPAARNGCPDGWYQVEPRGYVCVGSTATIDPKHPLLSVTSARPNRRAGLPYRYGRSRYPAPPLYSALPSGDVQEKSEPDLPKHLHKAFGLPWAGSVSSDVPPAVASGELLPRPFGFGKSGAVYRGRALPKSAFAFTELFESGGRSWGLTTDYSVIPLDRVTPVTSSSFAGVQLGPGEALPVAFVRKQGEQLFTGDPEKGLSIARPVQFREGFRLSGRVVRSGGVTFHETASGEFLREHDQLLIVQARTELPKPARRHRTFIDISLQRQTLVAYEHGVPVFATLVSAGRDGLGDPTTTHSTVQGFFLVHTKHVTATMSGDEADDEFDLRDVPYVQYFHEGYALHAAYWHDGFGTPRSHGCINLAPDDARFLFGWTDPPVPEAWHSALSREGTLVYIHP